jgi:hypothetical protein
MAEFRQGYLDDYSQNSTGVGIGTSSPVDAKFEIVGGTTSQELNVTGIATFGSVSGFIEKHTTYTENVNITNGDSGTLSGEIVVGAGLTMTVGTGATTSQGSVDSLKISNMFQPPSGGTNQRPPGKPGALFYNFDLKTIEFFDGNSWRQVDNTTRRGRGFAFGGYDVPTAYSTIRFVEMATQGNAQYFGDLSATTRMSAAFGNATRGIHGVLFPSNNANIDYITIASGGNAIDWGADRTASAQQMASLASSTRGIFAGGASTNVIDFIEISTTGNCTDFGDISNVRRNIGGFASPTRGVISAGGEFGVAHFKSTDFITIASKGNATDAGDLIGNLSGVRTCSNHTRGIFMGGYNPVASIDDISFVTTASLGNAVDFGNLSTIRREGSCVSNQTRGMFIGGNQAWPNTGFTNVIEFIEIATGGDATDFGNDLLTVTQIGGGCSDSHGGLGGF